MVASWTADYAINMLDGAIAYLKSKARFDNNDMILYQAMMRFMASFDPDTCPTLEQASRIRELHDELARCRYIRCDTMLIDRFCRGDD